jgi:hypothetical protein
VRYLKIKVITVFAFIINTNLTAFADNTIIIKKYKRPSKSLLDRKIIYMDMREAPSNSNANSIGLNKLSSPGQSSKAEVKQIPQKIYQVKDLEKKQFGVNTLAKKSQLDSIGKNLSKSFNRKTDAGQGDLNSASEYSDKDWDEYTQYTDIVMEESLNVQAKIRQ